VHRVYLCGQEVQRVELLLELLMRDVVELGEGLGLLILRQLHEAVDHLLLGQDDLAEVCVADELVDLRALDSEREEALELADLAFKRRWGWNKVSKRQTGRQARGF
jgi:hypothetical protein